MYRTPICTSLVSAAILALASGCSSRADELQQKVDALERTLGALRAESSAIKQRLDAIEPRVGDGAAAAVAENEGATGDQGASDRPRLEVVRLLPQGSDAPADPWKPGFDGAAAPAAREAAEGEPRPVIRGDSRGAKVVESGPDSARDTQSPAANKR